MTPPRITSWYMVKRFVIEHHGRHLDLPEGWEPFAGGEGPEGYYVIARKVCSL